MMSSNFCFNLPSVKEKQLKINAKFHFRELCRELAKFSHIYICNTTDFSGFVVMQLKAEC